MPNDRTYIDEDTLFKARRALEDRHGKVFAEQIVSELGQGGILIREPFKDDMEPVEAMTLLDTAKQTVYLYVKERLEKTDTHITFGRDEVYVVWFCKILQNWKALISTTLPDGMYYEVTYNGDAKEIYLDAYKKFENIRYDLVGPTGISARS